MTKRLLNNGYTGIFLLREGSSDQIERDDTAMSKQSESALSKRIINALNSRGHYVHKNHGSRMSLEGLSDITGAAADARAILFETKMPGLERSTLTAAQSKFLRDAVSLNPDIIAAVVSSVQQAIRFVESPDYVSVISDDGYFVTRKSRHQLNEGERRRYEASRQGMKVKERQRSLLAKNTGADEPDAIFGVVMRQEMSP